MSVNTNNTASKEAHPSRYDRIKVFEDTINWINSDADLTASIKKAKRNTEVFYENDYPQFDLERVRQQDITVTTDRSYQAAMRLSKEYPGAKIAVMNFANAFHPGGGVTQGASAQEECLCRCSTLYPLLYRRTLKDKFYDYHKKLNSPKATDTLVYTEGVVICKTDEALPQRMSKEDWVTVDVITIAAPDLRTKSNMYASLVGNGTFMNDAELFGYHVKRAIHMLTVAASKNADILVLGAFGCGAFQNDPAIVAKAYKTALDMFPKVFTAVEFAVYCSPADPTNYVAFRKVFDSKTFWFDTNEDKEVRLVRMNGTYEVCKDKPRKDLTKFAARGWQRAMLYIKELNIWDLTAFACDMDTTLGRGWITKNGDKRAYAWVGCEAAEKRIFKNLDKDTVSLCKKYADDFYKDSELQIKWKDLILHPICFELSPNGTITPVRMSDVPEEVAHMESDPINLFAPESWVFFRGNITP